MTPELLARIERARARMQALKAEESGTAWCPQKPHPKQELFLQQTAFECMFGGSAGPGKSSALLMAALRYMHIPNYAALILRRTFADLAKPGAIMDRAKEWLIPQGVHWNAADKRFTFPIGATLSFGYLDSDVDRYRYQGAELQTVCFDEVTQFPESWYLYLLSRIRRTTGMDAPLQVRSAGNPGGIGHAWVKRRFVDANDPARVFIPAVLADNPSLNAEEYTKTLELLDPVTRRQLLDGIWVQDGSGLVYRQFDEARNVIEAEPPGIKWRVLAIDYGFTDATAWSLLGWRPHDPCVYVLCSFCESGLTPNDAAEVTQEILANHPCQRVIGDIGGLGKGYAEEARRRFHIPIEPADKINKRGYIDLLNGALSRGHVKIVRDECEQLTKEWLELPWAEGRQKEAPGVDNHCCLIAGTRIETEAGPVPIEEVVPGTMVMTRAGLRKVTHAWCEGLAPTWRMGTLEGTGNHPIATVGGWVLLRDIQYSDILFAWKSSGSRSLWSSAEDSTEGIRMPERTRRECISGPRLGGTCIETSGAPRTGRSREVSMSTTQMGTHAITNWATSDVCTAESIEATTQTSQNQLPTRDGTLFTRLPPHQRGTAVPRGSSGTEGTEGPHGSGGPTLAIPAPFAPSSTRRAARCRTSARTNASLSSGEIPGSMTSGDIANFAEAPTSHPNTASKGFALVRATHATPTGREALVYNLTVEGEHEFVANGIVTKNSDATLYGWRAATAFAQKPEELVIRPPGSAARFIAQEEEMLARAADDAKNGKTRPFWLKGRSGQRTQQTARARAMGWRVLG